MGIREDLERYRAQGREHRKALIEAEDATIMKGDNCPPPAIQPKFDQLQPTGTTYTDPQPPKRIKYSDSFNDEISKSSTTTIKRSTSCMPTGQILETAAPVEKDSVAVFAPIRKGPRNNATYKTQHIIDTRPTIKTSSWYAGINLKEKFARGDVQIVAYIITLCQNYVSAAKKQGADGEKIILEIRTKLHEMEFLQCVSGIIIKKSRILEDDGLPRIFDNQDGVEFPWDLRADAKALYLRWIVGDLDPHLLRGIITSKGQLDSGMKRTSHKLDKNYPFKRSANVVGDNHIINGQWWPSRICALRDGAHGEQEAGIHGQTGKGAYSVVISQGGYADEDKGMAIEYCGTQSETSTPTKSTNLLLEACKTKQPLRVLRAENKNSRYAPKKGIRYDGLYTAVEYEILDEKTAMYRFSLRRCKNQDPIRYVGQEIRPTDQELRQLSLIRDHLGKTAG